MKTKTSHMNVQKIWCNIITGLIKVLFTIAVFILFTGCSDDNSVQTVSSGSFYYTAYDTSGIPVVNGWMTIDIQDSGKVAGGWHFSKIGDPENIGPCIGEGILVGSLENGRLDISLNPEYRDNNVFLTGYIQADKYTGDWNWSGFAGIINNGYFIAVKY